MNLSGCDGKVIASGHGVATKPNDREAVSNGEVEIDGAKVVEGTVCEEVTDEATDDDRGQVHLDEKL